jgi:hydroxymethylpyrimidine/phosphomethylpyrimidine kinase
MPPVILSIAGYDPSSGAGITADVKTAAAHGCYAATCITALTVQSTQEVFAVQPLSGDLVRRTLHVLRDDLEIAAIRLGMLGSGEVAAVVADFLELAHPPNIVLDPVIRSSSGTALLDEVGIEIVRTRLIPISDIMTPNLHEAAFLLGAEILPDHASWSVGFVRELASGLHGMGAKAVVITGGHVDPPNDYLSFQAGELIIPGERIESRSTHGTGCAYATALACHLAQGMELSQAVRAAKEFVAGAIRSAYPVGKGIGPVNQFG